MEIPIRGMHCKSCELLVESQLKEVKGVERVEVSQVKGLAKVWFHSKTPSRHEIYSAVETAGYEVGQKEVLPLFSKNWNDYRHLINAAGILFFLFVLARFVGLGNINASFSEKSIVMAGVVGLVAGFSSCMALIGGLVLGMSARHAELHPEASVMQKFRPHLFFNVGRILGFAFFGGMVGVIGSALQPSPKVLAILTIGVGIVMVLLGLKLVEIFPVLRDKSLTLPRFILKLFGINREIKEYSHKATFVSGALTFFLPCGFTQAMQLYAISTGSIIQGALIMSLFALGTTPGLLGIGGLSAAFKGKVAKQFFATAGLAVILLGMFNITNASKIAFPRNESELRTDSAEDQGSVGFDAKVPDRLLQAEYKVGPGMFPKTFTVKAGDVTRLEVFASEEDYGCMSTIMIPGLYNKVQFLKKGEIIAMQFVPKKKGIYPITCAMGINHGTLRVE